MRQCIRHALVQYHSLNHYFIIYFLRVKINFVELNHNVNEKLKFKVLESIFILPLY